MIAEDGPSTRRCASDDVPKAPVLVIGASSRIGRAVVTELRRLGRPVRALVHQPPPTPFPPEVEVVVGDLTDPASLTPALAGVEAVFLV